MKCFVVNQNIYFFQIPIYWHLPNTWSLSSYDLKRSCPPKSDFSLSSLLAGLNTKPTLSKHLHWKSKCNGKLPRLRALGWWLLTPEKFTKIITWYKNVMMSIYLGRWEKAATETKVWAMNQTTCTLSECLQLEKPLQRLSETLLQPNLCAHFKVNTLKLNAGKGLPAQSPASMTTLMSREPGSEEESAKDSISWFRGSECKLGLPLSSVAQSSWGLGQTAGSPHVPSHLYSGMGSTGHRVAMPLGVLLRHHF